jgi:hypothetical protein
MTTIHLWQESPQVKDGMVTLGATLEQIPQEQRKGIPQKSCKFLYYQLAEQHQHLLSDNSDAFLVAILFLAMHQGTDVIVHGAVSPSLLTNLEEFQSAWVNWAPKRYQRVNIQAETIATAPPQHPSRQAITTFSGGVDSCFTAFRYHKTSPEQLRYQVTAALMVHGFDIPLHEQQMFQGAAQRSRRMLDSLDINLIEMATNFRQVINYSWPKGFTTALASSLLLLQQKFAAGIIPSSDSYKSMFPMYASNPISDRLLSTHNFEIIHDRLASRVEKLTVLADWPEAMQNLRVCWQGKQKDRNCGRCEKCIRTILSCRVAGISLPGCFEQDVSNSQLLSLIIPWSNPVIEMRDVLANARAVHIQESWVTALTICVLVNQFLSTGVKVGLTLVTLMAPMIKRWYPDFFVPF